MQQTERLAEVLNETVTQQSVESREVVQMRLENDAMFAQAAIRPRNFAKIKDGLLQQLQDFPELAEISIYTKPVGQGKTVEGLSVRAAEVLAEAYGFNRIRSDVTPLDEDHVRVEATFTDYAGGRVWQDGGIMSRWYRSQSGQMQRHGDDRFYNVVVKAEISKRVREVILRSVNASLKAWLENACREQLTRILDPQKVQQIVYGFKTLGVTDQQLESFIGRPRSLGWTDQDRLKLVGLWTAIRENETTIGEAFGKVQQVVETPTPAGLLDAKVAT